MKKINEMKIGNLKQVFTSVKNNFQKLSKYQLGEDFYNFDNGDEENKIEEPSNTTLSMKQN